MPRIVRSPQQQQHHQQQQGGIVSVVSHCCIVIPVIIRKKAACTGNIWCTGVVVARGLGLPERKHSLLLLSRQRFVFVVGRKGRNGGAILLYTL